MAKTIKRKKGKNYIYNGFNITLQSDDRRGEEAYFDIFRQLFLTEITVRVNRDRAMTVKNQFQSEVTFMGKDYKILRGSFVRYMILDDDSWYDKGSKELIKFRPPDGIYPMGREVEYVFIPAIHQLYIIANSQIGLKSIEKFLLLSLPKVAGLREEIKVSLIQSFDAIEQIIRAPVLKNLRIQLSYTNDDVSSEAAELMDNYLKEAHIGDIEIYAKPDQKGSIDASSTMVDGLLSVARYNGEAEALIVNDEGKQDKIITKDHPEKKYVYVESDEDPYSRLIHEVLTSRPDGEV